MTTQETFTMGMARLGAAFNRTLDPLVLDTYWDALGGLQADDLARAFGRAVMECKFFPVPAELRAFARKALPDAAALTTLRLEAMKPDESRLPTAADFEELRAMRKAP